MKRCTREAIGAGIAVLLVAIGPAGALADGPTPRRAAAPEPPKPDWTLSANVGLASEYVFRGVSQSAENPAIQGGLDVAWRWLYAGVWASNLDFGGRANGRGVLKDVANIEIDTYAGIKHSLGRLDLDIGVIRYNYPNAFDQRIPSSTGFWFTEQRELDYVEAKVSVSTKLLDRVTVGATAFFSPEYTNRTGEVWTFEGSVAIELPKVAGLTTTVSALAGHQIGDDPRYRFLIANAASSYTYWNAGVTIGFLDRLALDLRYWDTNIANDAATKPIGNLGFGSNSFCDGQATGIFQCDARFVATLKYTTN